MKVNEIFYSIQGEGYWSGTPAIFVRFAGCNLSCKFCDTDHDSSFIEMEPEDILAEVKNYSQCKHVVFTGGEPLLQINKELLSLFERENYYIQIETNGTIKISKDIYDYIDWITVSPKEPIERWIQKDGNELKLVHTGGQDLKRYFDSSSFDEYFIQPCSGQNINQCIQLCKENTQWRLSIQLQKMLKIR